MSKTATIIALLVLLALVLVYVTKGGASSVTSVFEDGDVAAISCTNPEIIAASYGPAAASPTCPTADVTIEVQQLFAKGKPFNVSASVLGVSDTCTGEARQLTVKFRCPATTGMRNSSTTTYGSGGSIATRATEHFMSSADDHPDEPDDTRLLRWRPGVDRRLLPTPYSKGPPLAEGLWSNAAGLEDEGGIARRRIAVRQAVAEGPATDGDSWADRLVANDAEAMGVYLPGNHHGPKREPGWAIRPDKRRTNWVL